LTGQDFNFDKKCLEMVDYIAWTIIFGSSVFSIRRTMFKTLREKVQEAEIAHRDPTTIVLKSTRKR